MKEITRNVKAKLRGIKRGLGEISLEGYLGRYQSIFVQKCPNFTQMFVLKVYIGFWTWFDKKNIFRPGLLRSKIA